MNTVFRPIPVPFYLEGDVIYQESTEVQRTCTIRSNRSNGADDGILQLCAAGAFSNGRGGYLELRGENAVSASGQVVLNASGDMYLQGANADSNIFLRSNGKNVLTIPADAVGSFKTYSGNESTGAGTALLGAANCPAVTVSAPFKWIKAITSDGSVVYFPVWK